MHKVIFSPQAANDLDQLWNFIAEDNEYYASKVLDTVFWFAAQLAIFPLLGQENPHDTSLRSVVEPTFRYRISYGIKNDVVMIYAIFKYKDI